MSGCFMKHSRILLKTCLVSTLTNGYIVAEAHRGASDEVASRLQEILTKALAY